uniref:Uncharacterized protein n=1 Tax=Falco tinnunculus TaxID=100819 RepID=A0A8C4UB35_FALTI
MITELYQKGVQGIIVVNSEDRQQFDYKRKLDSHFCCSASSLYYLKK